MSAAHLPLRPDGVRTRSAKAVAKSLGVGRELIEGLVIGKAIRGYRVTGKTGESTVVVDVADLERIEDLIRTDGAQ